MASTGRAASVAIVRGEPTSEELAAVLAVLAGRAQRANAGEAAWTARSAWSDRARLLRAADRVGPGGWWRSGLPRLPGR